MMSYSGGSGGSSRRNYETPQLKGKVRSTLTRLYRYARPYYSQWLVAGLTILGIVIGATSSSLKKPFRLGIY